MARVARHAVHQRSAIQDESELAAFLTLVHDLQPEVVLEVGTSRGGTMYALQHAAAPTATLMSLDKWEQVTQHTMQAWAQPGQHVISIIMDSHHPDALWWVRDHLARLNRDELDLLFIDADHHYKDVAEDWKMYAPLVRPGGIVSFHDINRTAETQEGCEVGVWWEEFKSAHPNAEVYEFVNPESAMGIGAYRAT